jgi:hypothetical protein
MCRLSAILIIGLIAAYSIGLAVGKPEYLVRGFIIATVALGIGAIRTSAKASNFGQEAVRQKR